ncbi:DoxX family protein [Marinigracilibium pacificum]|uniref:DoxX family membrane protein n=1 Tax=Marinigracilibium pacificum TaxID=2729599 RepID=A0A848IVR7_9BACT|nr:DoxX family protein [Marinigracilibium pacificum]NMM47375.1 DoxX family membrane protein [Marinigracilibium pacificum]
MKNKILFVVSLLIGLMMINSGLNKFLQYMPMPEMNESAGQLMAAFAQARWLFPLIAIAEIVGGILLIVPKTRALGAIVLFPVIVGIFLFHAVLDPSTVMISIILLLLNILILFDNRSKYLPMIR